jgi:hypothetical protein
MRSALKLWIQISIVIFISLICCATVFLITIYLLLPPDDAAYNAGIFFFLNPFVITICLTFISVIGLPLIIASGVIILCCHILSLRKK